MQRALDINSLQLMLKQMPLSAAILLPVIVLAEDVTVGPQPLVALPITPQLVGLVVLTACMAFFVNVSTFYIIAELSPIRSLCRTPPPPLILLCPQTVCLFRLCAALTRRRSYNVLGHCKTCVIIVGGALMFREVQFLPPLPPSRTPPHARCRALTCRKLSAWCAASQAPSGTRGSTRTSRRRRLLPPRLRLTAVTAARNTLCRSGSKARASSWLRRAVHRFTRAVLRL